MPIYLKGRLLGDAMVGPNLSRCRLLGEATTDADLSQNRLLGDGNGWCVFIS